MIKWSAIEKRLEGDRPIWMMVGILSLVSIVAVYSSISSLAYKYEGSTFQYLMKHGIMIISGLGIMFAVHKMNHKYLFRLSQLAIWLAGILLVITLFFGTNINGASRWMTIPIINQNFQTSDFAKIAVIIYLARVLTLKRNELKSFREGVVPAILPVIIISGLILPANFSTAALVFGSALVVMLIAGVRLLHIAGIIGIGAAGFAMVIAINYVNPEIFPRAETWKNRTLRFIGAETDDAQVANLQENYQVEMAKIAIWNGGALPNLLPGNATSRNYLPHPYSDMIYAFIIEEYGSIIGGLGLLLLYVMLFYRVVRISNKAEKSFSSYLVIGLGFMITLQAFVNMAVAVNLIPVTGQPLPLVSMGGTSIWFTCIAIGIILSVSRVIENGTLKTT